MTFDKIQAQAISEWEALNDSDRPRILIGIATCSQKVGALAVLEAIKSALAKNNIEATITQVGCIGLCYAEPLVDIIKPNRPRISYGCVTPQIVPQLIEDYLINDNPRPDLALGTIGDDSIDGIPKLFELPMLKPQMRILLHRCGTIDPENINHYIANNGYSGLVKALGMAPEEVIEQVKKSGLRGRGGAGFPTGLKWESCRSTPGEPKYFICNAAEGDPGSFVDRTLLEGDPHAVLEGMIIGAYAIGAGEGYIYIHSGSALAIKRLEAALKQASEKGFVGDNILGSGFSFHVKIWHGDDAYICGEETALISSIEGKREVGIPRIRPPYPAQVGLWSKPTCVNNVETLANVPHIIEKTGDWYAGIGTERSKGTKLLSLSGNIVRTGIVEVPFGLTLQRLVEDIGGGIPNGHKLKVIQPAGVMLGLIPASLVDQPIDFDALTKIGSGLGSGGLIVIDDSACIVDVAHSLVSFACNEMCGKCSIGRLGTKQLLVILENITNGRGRPQDIDLLTELTESVSPGTLCPLCGGVPSPTKSILQHFRDELEAHIKEHRCPANVCQGLGETSKSQQ
ncbi:MAG: NADH-quinone oxidoreductase subunit F [Dehalococcoidia bacterium]|nr:NADH-quinone oxidoreductase subunit F [Dehalococcoidia bacterium]